MTPRARPLLASLLASLVGLALTLVGTSARAMPANPLPRLAAQPDGATFLRVLRGDERGSHFETLDGYSIVRGAGDAWVYAELDPQGHLAPTDLLVTQVDPELSGLVPHLQDLDRAPEPPRSPPPLLVGPDAPAVGMRAAGLGTAKHLVILAAFADHWDYAKRTVDARFAFTADRYAALMNEPGHSADGAQGSVADYFDEATHGQLRVDSVVTAWVRLPDVQARYANVDGQGGDDGGRLARDALAALEAAGFDFASVDGDDDQWVDMLTVVHSGWDAADGNGKAGYVWSHASAIDAVTYDGVRAARYTTVAALRDLDGTYLVTRIGTTCHELGHFLGVRDFYDTDGADFGDGAGLGNWSIMATSGWTGGGARPGPFDAYTRSLFGWVVPTRIHSLPSDTGLVFLLPRAADSTGGVFRVDDGLADGEYLLVEHYGEGGRFHRFPDDEGLAEGVAIWHVDERLANNDHSATPTLMRARLVEADGDQSLTTAGGWRSEAGDVWAPGAGALLTLDASHPSGGGKANAGYDAGLAIIVGGDPSASDMTLGTRTRVPQVTLRGAAVVAPGEAVALAWGAASGAAAYAVERGRDEARDGYRDDAEDPVRWLEDWQARGSWQRYDHAGKNVGGAADGGHSYAAVGYSWSTDDAPALVPKAYYRDGHFTLTFRHPVWLGAGATISWREKRALGAGNFARLQLRDYEGGDWTTVRRVESNAAAWWDTVTVSGAPLAPFSGRWVELRFEVVLQAYAPDLFWPHTGLVIDRFELAGVTLYLPTWTVAAEVPADTTSLDLALPETAGDWLLRVRAIDSGGTRGAPSNAVRATTAVGADTTPPGGVSDLRVTASYVDALDLAFTACGDDGAGGTATLDLRRAPDAITEASWAAAVPVPVDAVAGGSAVELTADGLGAYSSWSFAVRCRDERGNVGPLSNVVSARTKNLPPEAPTLTSPADGATDVRTDAALRWQNGLRTAVPVSPSDYSVVVLLSTSQAAVAGTQASALALATDGLATEHLRAGGLAPDTTYYWRVIDANATAATASPVRWFRTRGGDVTAPAAITDLVVDGVYGVAASLGWTAPGDDGASGQAARYDLRIARSPIDAASFAAAEPLTATAPAPPGLADGVYLIGLAPKTTYWVAVKTEDEVPNASPISNIASFTTLEVAAPAAPSAPSPADGAVVVGAAALTWQNGAGTAEPPDRARAPVQVFFATERARVEAMALGTSPDAPSALVAEGPSGLAAWTPPALPVGGTYYWRVVDRNAGGATAGPVWSFRVAAADEVAPGAITDLAVADRGDDHVELTWTAPGDDGAAGTAMAYEARLARAAFTADGLGAIDVAPDAPAPLPAGATQRWTLGGLEAGASYWLVLRAADETGRWGAPSAVVAFETTGGATVEPGPDAGPEADAQPETTTVETSPEVGPEVGPEPQPEPQPEAADATNAPGPEATATKGSDGCAGAGVDATGGLALALAAFAWRRARATRFCHIRKSRA